MKIENVKRRIMEDVWVMCTLLVLCIIASELTLNIPRGVLRGPPLVCYWLTSVEINKHKMFDTINA